MKKSLKMSINILIIITIILTYIFAVILTDNDVITSASLFSFKSLFYLFLIITISVIINTIIYRSFSFPLKKMEKSMQNVADGKIIDNIHLNNYSKFKETDDFIAVFNDMMQIIRKNTFDLSSQQSKTEIILEHMADGVVAFSIKRQVVHMNKSAMRLLDISNVDDTFDIIMKKLKIIDLDFDMIMYLPNYKTISRRVVIKDNVLNLVFVPFYNDNNLSPMGVIMVARNVTENVKLDNMRKEFVANVSHELKTPLTSIRGYSETMMNGGLTEDEVIRFSKVINQESNRMSKLVSDLLQLSRFDYKKVSWKKMMFSLDELAQNVCDKMVFTAGEKHHKLECVVTVKPPRVYADRDAIEQVIVNIISNSIKYTPDGGIIKVYVGSINSNAYLKVIDNGIGIPEKDLQRIFERFYRVDKARSRQMGGTGLGLSIVKEIIDGNNGTIEIKSKVGQGTQVIITLPTKIKAQIN